MALPLDDGFSTIISIGGTNLYEKTVKLPGLDGGGPIDITTMRNTAYRTQAAKSLIALSDAPFQAAFAPAAYSTLLSVVNLNQAITYTFPDASTLVVWGWLGKFEPNDMVEGEHPTAECMMHFSNIDGAGAEIAPAYAAAP